VKQASTPKYNINTCLNRNARAYRAYLTKVAAKTAKCFSNIPRSTNIYQIGFRKQGIMPHATLKMKYCIAHLALVAALPCSNEVQGSEA